MSVEQIQDVVEALASRLGRSVAVDDHTLHLIAVSPDFGDSDAARVWSVLHRRTRPEDVSYARLRRLDEPARLAADPELGLEARLMVPVRHRGSLLGFIWLIDRDQQITAAEEGEVVEAAAQLGALLHRRLVVRDRDHALAAYLVELLVSADSAARASAAADLLTHGLVEDDAHIGVLVAQLPTTSDDADDADDVDDDGTDLAAVVERACRPLPGGCRVMASRGRRATVLVARRRSVEQDLAQVAATLHDLIPTARIGLGAPSEGLGAASAAHRQALVAISVATALDRTPGVVHFADLGPYALLGQLPGDLIDNELLPLGLFHLLRLGRDNDLLHTLETFLDQAGDKQRTAAVLTIHRSTLYTRLERIERISGLDLDKGQDRLLAHLAIKLLRLDPRTRPGGAPA